VSVQVEGMTLMSYQTHAAPELKQPELPAALKIGLDHGLVVGLRVHAISRRTLFVSAESRGTAYRVDCGNTGLPVLICVLAALARLRYSRSRFPTNSM